MSRYYDYFYIFLTIILTVYGQMIIKWRISSAGELPSHASEKIKFLITMIADPLVFSGFLAAFFASLAWMAAMTKFDLSHAYPFMSLNFVVVLLLSGWLLSEPISIHKTLGLALIVIGTVLASRG